MQIITGGLANVDDGIIMVRCLDLQGMPLAEIHEEDVWVPMTNARSKKLVGFPVVYDDMFTVYSFQVMLAEACYW